MPRPASVFHVKHRPPRRLARGRAALLRGWPPASREAPRAGAHAYVSCETRPCSPAGRQPPGRSFSAQPRPRPACGPAACSRPPIPPASPAPAPRIHCRLPKKWPKTLRFTPLGGRIAASRQSRPGETRSSPRRQDADQRKPQCFWPETPIARASSGAAGAVRGCALERVSIWQRRTEPGRRSSPICHKLGIIFLFRWGLIWERRMRLAMASVAGVIVFPRSST